MDLRELMCEAVRGGLYALDRAQKELSACPGLKGLRPRYFVIAREANYRRDILVRWPSVDHKDGANGKVRWDRIDVRWLDSPLDSKWTALEIALDALRGDPDRVLFAVYQLHKAAWWCRFRAEGLRRDNDERKKHKKS